MTFRIACAALAFAAIVPAASAKVEHVAPDTMTIAHSYRLAGTKPAKAWKALLQPGKWWPSGHTWSGDARHLSLDASPGGCFCERWDGGGAEHGRVILFRRDELLRLDAPLGPLQEMGLDGMLQVKLAADGEDTTVEVRFRVSGDSAHPLDKMADVVDRVLGEQFGRYADFAPDGRIETPPAPTPGQ